jgi:type II secretory pathway pseudopilin PulG
MKRISDNQHSKYGFTIIELLTVMSIIIILIGLLVPSLNRVRRYSTDVKQRAQFHSIAVALDLFNAEFDGYPNSDAMDDQTTPQNYSGAMKLAEALVGQDLKGFNPASRFRRSGFGTATPTLGMPYPPLNTCGGATDIPCYNENVKSRKMYLQLENANAYQLRDIYALADIAGATSPGVSATGFDPNTYVLCDSYNRVTNKTTGKKMGMPILYYRADPARLKHPLPTDAPGDMITANANGAYVYNYLDNQVLIDMGMPWVSSNYVHPLASGGLTLGGTNITNRPKKFYDITRDLKVSTGDRPVRADSYILISAGFDGEYGTKDDIANFGD